MIFSDNDRRCSNLFASNMRICCFSWPLAATAATAAAAAVAAAAAAFSATCNADDDDDDWIFSLTLLCRGMSVGSLCVGLHALLNQFEQ